MLFVLRIIIGLIFLVSGFEKVISPYQNFLYVLQSYQMFSFLPGFPSWLADGMEKWVAIAVPWLELMVGVFIVLGLWLELSLKGALVFFACFVVVVGQALLRQLPIDQCGCFGESIHIAPRHIIVFDSLMLLSTYWLIKHLPKAKKFSLDLIFKN